MSVASSLWRAEPVPARAPRRQALVVRAGAPAAATLLASTHYVLNQPAALAALSGMAATAAWTATDRPKPPLSRRGALSRQSAAKGMRATQAAAAAAVPVMVLLAVRAGLTRLAVESTPVGGDAVVLTLGAGLAGVHAALAGAAFSLSHGLLQPERFLTAVVVSAALAAPLGSVAYALAAQHGARVAQGVPTAVMWACYGAVLGQQVGGALADRLRAPLVLQGATCLGAALGVTAALALWRV